MDETKPEVKKNHWENSVELLQNLLVKKREEIVKMNEDIEEIEFSIECYKRKITGNA